MSVGNPKSSRSATASLRYWDHRRQRRRPRLPKAASKAGESGVVWRAGISGDASMRPMPHTLSFDSELWPSAADTRQCASWSRFRSSTAGRTRRGHLWDHQGQLVVAEREATALKDTTARSLPHQLSSDDEPFLQRLRPNPITSKIVRRAHPNRAGRHLSTVPSSLRTFSCITRNRRKLMIGTPRKHRTGDWLSQPAAVWFSVSVESHVARSRRIVSISQTIVPPSLTNRPPHRVHLAPCVN